MCWNSYRGVGVTVLTMDDSTCQVVNSRTYHTSELTSEAWALAGDLQQAKHGSWLIGVSGNDASNQLEPALPTLFALGVYVSDVKYRGSFVFAIKKGDISKTTMNKTTDNTEQPARLDVIISGTHTLCSIKDRSRPADRTLRSFIRSTNALNVDINKSIYHYLQNSNMVVISRKY